MTGINWDEFAEEAFDQALATLLWSSTDDDGESLDGCEDQVSQGTRDEILVDLKDFLSISHVRSAIQDLCLTPDTVGQDFFLSANRVGTGFWARSYGEQGDTLHSWTEGYHRDLYRGDDGVIY